MGTIKLPDIDQKNNVSEPDKTDFKLPNHVIKIIIMVNGGIMKMLKFSVSAVRSSPELFVSTANIRV